MRRLKVVTAFAVLVLSTGINAEPYDDAARAYADGNVIEALSLWKSLAAVGDARAQYQLGVMHESGHGVTTCNAGAFDWYLRSARNGHAPAQFAVARMYHSGKGVARNPAEARKWEQALAANRSDPLQVAARPD